MTKSDWLSKKLILITGKGGVGKTMISRAAARHLASQGKRVLLVHVLSLGDEEQKIEKVAPNLWQITLRASDCFREYIILKLRVKTLYTAFLGNKVTQYLERAAPGVREITMIGKIWYERSNYDHIVVDMPSTGYALTMIHTPFNFGALFPGGPIYNDCQQMIETFSDPKQTAFVTVSLAEEMPIQESTELAAEFKKLMPANPSYLVMNRLIRVAPEARALHSRRYSKLTEDELRSPLWRGLDFLVGREARQSEFLTELRQTWAPFTGTWIEIDEVVTAGDEQVRAQMIAGRLETGGLA